MTVNTSSNRYATANFIVAPTLAQGANYTTIASALTAASSGSTVFIKPGTYTEDLTLKAGVNLAAYDCDALTPNVTISGTCTFTAAGTVAISGIRLQTNSANLLAVTGSAASIVWLKNCYLNCTNNTGISFTSSDAGAIIRVQNCFGNIGTTGISLFSCSSAGAIGFLGTTITNSGGSTTASTSSSTFINATDSGFNIPFTTSSTGAINFNNVIISVTNTTCVTTAGTTATNTISNGQFTSGTASAISIGSGTTLAIFSSVINSSNTNAITGAGALVHSGLSFVSSSVINTTTITNRAFGRTGTFTPVLNFGGATTGITYSQQFGQFSQMGDRVDFTVLISLSNKGSATGNATITGFPITVGTVGAVAAMGYYGIITLTATYTTLSLQMNGGATTANLIQSNEIGSGQIFTTHLNYANTSLFTVTGFYFTT